MGSTVEIYVKYAGPGQRLAHRVAETLDLVSYFYNGAGYVLPVDARRWIDVEGWGQVILDATDLGRDGDPGAAEGTAYEPYEYELSVDFRGPRERLGRAIFDRLAAGLGLPLAYGDYEHVFADFRPGQGVRDFPPGTSVEFDPGPLGVPTAPWEPSPSPYGRVTVFETDGLLRFVPTVQTGLWVRPVASARSSVGARDIGLLLGGALGTTGQPERDDREPILTSLAVSTPDFAGRSVSIEVHVDRDGLVAVPHAPHPGAPAGADVSGPVVDELVRRAPADLEPAALGELVLDLIDRLRSRVAA